MRTVASHRSDGLNPLTRIFISRAFNGAVEFARGRNGGKSQSDKRAILNFTLSSNDYASDDTLFSLLLSTVLLRNRSVTFAGYSVVLSRDVEGKNASGDFTRRRP